MELLLSPIFGEILRKAKVLNRWRWTFIRKEVRQHFLDKEEARAQAEDIKVAIVAENCGRREKLSLRKLLKRLMMKRRRGSEF